MSKLCIFTDNHFCETSTAVKKSGTYFTARLENQIQSLNWVEQTAVEKNCDYVVCLGDFFNSATLTEVELTALQKISWNNLTHYFLVGNHESEDIDLGYSSTRALEAANRIIIDSAQVLDFPTVSLGCLPYVTERNRKKISEYFTLPTDKPRIILSHNDLKDIQMGPVKTQTGFEIDDIEANCDLFLNGHLHNGMAITKKIINLGNLTAQDYKEDASKYRHNIMILDTDTLQYELVENPYAVNVFNLEVHTEADLAKISKISKVNSVVSVKYEAPMIVDVRKALTDNKAIIDYRMIVLPITKEIGTVVATAAELLAVDPVSELTKFCHEKLGQSELLDFELTEICK